MKLNEIKKSYNNWVRYTDESLRDDFAEYKGKEDLKWKTRAAYIGVKFPIFDDLTEFKKYLDSGEIINVDSLKNVDNLTKNHSLEDIKQMVSTYSNTFAKPRDVDRIANGINNNDKLPLPIILKGSKGTFIMAGNTRQAVARVLGMVPKAILVDMSK
jgi:hypothetical protein